MKRSNVVLTGSPSLFTVKNLLTSALLACALNISPGAWAQQLLFWDVNDTTAGAGAAPTGVWDTTLLNWNLDPLGEAGTQVWLDNNDAAFAAGTDATGPYTVTLGAPISARNLIFEQGIVTLNNLASHLFSVAGPIDVLSGATAVINTPISSSGDITKLGSGTLVLGADLAGAQNVAVLGGTLSINDATRLAAALGDIVLNNG